MSDVQKLESLKQDILNDVRAFMQTTGQVTQYIGARYVPLFAEPLDWDNQREYEPLTIVLHAGNSFTSRQFVPKGIDINNTDFWAKTGNYNAQIEQYRQEVEKLRKKIGKSYSIYDNVSDLASDATLKVGETVVTRGFYSPNDSGGTTYQLKSGETANGMDKIACQNGLTAVIQPTPTLAVEQLGGKITPTFDNLAIFKRACELSNSVLLAHDGIYGISDILQISKNNLTITGNSTIRLIPSGTGETDRSNSGVLIFNKCNNLKLNGITVDGNAHYIKRPSITSELFAEYLKTRNNSYPGLRVINSDNVAIDNCTVTNCAAAFNFSSVTNSSLCNSTSIRTMADGVFISGASRYIHVSSHTCIEVGDDCYSADGYYTDENKNPKYITFDSCTAVDCFGALTCLEGCTYCTTSNSISYNNQYAPVKLGELNDEVVAPAHDLSVINCQVYTNNPDYSYSSLIALVHGTGTVHTRDVIINGCNFVIEQSKYPLTITNVDHLLISDCIISVNTHIDINSTTAATISNCTITTDKNVVVSGCNGIKLQGNTFNTLHKVDKGTRCISMGDTQNLSFSDNTFNNKTTDAKGLYYPVVLDVSKDLKNITSDTPLELSGLYSKLTNFIYQGVYPSVGYTAPDYTVFNLGQLVALNDGLYTRGTTNYVKLQAFANV